jgi:ferrous iron transport protein A
MDATVIARFSDAASRGADVAPALRERDTGGRAIVEPAEEPAVAPADAEVRDAVPLTRLARHGTGIVAGVRIAAAGADIESDPALERMALRLIEIGFVKGAHLRVIAFGQPGDDPIGVRVGGRGGVSTFALRRQEASCVWVWPDPLTP